MAPWVVLVVALSVTALGAVFVVRVVAERDRMRFEDLVGARVRAVEQGVQSHVDALHATASLLALKPDLTRRDFRYFVERLEATQRYPYIQGIGWAPRVQGSQKQAFEELAREQYDPELEIWPSSQRATAYPVLFQEPAAARYGFDLGSVPAQRAALELAAATGDAVASEKLRLRAQPGESEGFVVFMPVYSGAHVPSTPGERMTQLRGFVYCPFQARGFFERVFGGSHGMTAVSVYDGPERSAARRYYADPPPPNRSSTFRTERTIMVAARTWHLEFASTPAFAERSQSHLLPIVVLGGLLLSLLLTGITWSETRARAAAERATAELGRSREALRRANATKDEFLAMLGHELRNPIGALANTVRVMRMTRPDDPALQRSLDVAARQVRQQTRLVDDLLDVSRMSTGKIRLQRQRVDLNEVVRSAVADARPRAEEQALTISFSPCRKQLTVDADPVRLVQVVTNLLNNAVKYTPAGGRIDVSVQERDDDPSRRAAVRVRDTGSGIEPEALAHIFDLFAQAESTKHRAQGGLGIGLTLAKQLVELHRGRIEAYSAGPGTGSEFTVWLPVVDALPDRIEYEDSRVSVRIGLDEAGTSALTMLVVEDNSDARQMLSDLLSLLGHRVVSAEDGRAGVEQAVKHRPDVALIDLGLPIMSGYEVARTLREDPRTSDCFLIALTGYGQPEDRQRALDNGFDEHMVKPFDVTRFSALLAGERRQRRRA